MTPHWLAYVPLGLLILTLLGGMITAIKLAVTGGKLLQRLDDIEKQFKPNGGSSLKDDTNKIKSDLMVLNTRFDDHLKHHTGTW